MNVKFFHTTTGQTLTELGLKLHDLLIQAGWTLEYADINAVGTGTATSPAWDNSFSAFTSGGRVLYKMPVTSLATRWYVEIELYYISNSNAYDIYFRTAKGVSVAGVAIDPGTLCGFNASSANRVIGEHIVTVTEHGLAVAQALQETTNCYICCERKRTLIGTPIDDIVIHGTGKNANVTGLGASYGTCRSRNTLSGESTAKAYAILLETISEGAQSPQVASLSASSGLLAIPAGPFITSGGIGGMSGHIVFFPNADVPTGTDQAVTVDGTNQVFFNPNNPGTHKYYAAFIRS
jgi:hypothetical protein